MARWLALKMLLAPFSTKCADSVALSRSVAFHRKGAYREAYRILRDFIARHPDLRYGDAYVHCANLELLVNDDPSKAGEFLDTALQLGCDNMAHYYCMSGYVFHRMGQRERGVREMERAVDLEATVYTLRMLAATLSFDGDTRAADIWKRVLEQEPLNCKARVGLGILAAKTGNREEALRMARIAETLDPKARELAEIAELYAEAGETRIALSKYAEVDRLGGASNGPFYAKIAICYFELGNDREGYKYLEEGRRLFPNSVSIKEAWDLYRDKYSRSQRR
jgi:tetratricopeptide (TPR) repeat protein